MRVRERISSWFGMRHHSSPRHLTTNQHDVSGTSSTCSQSHESIASKKSISGCRLRSENSTRTVHFADDNGKALEQVQHYKEKPLDEVLDEVFMKNGLVSAFIKIRNLEPGRKVLVRCSEDKWRTYKTYFPRRVERKIDSRGREHIQFIKEKNSRLLRKSKQVQPQSAIKTIPDTTYMAKVHISKATTNNLELVIISSLNGVIDPRHEQCYSLKFPQQDVES